MTVAYEGHGVTVHIADALDVLAGIADASVDAVVTDPPYGLEFMGKEWDAPWKQGADVHAEARNRRAEEMGDENKRRYIASAVNKYAAGLPFQQWCEMWATECLRVLKPGGHLLAFGGTRTWHRLACAVEDAGFEVRDSIAWMYGSGFPKSLDVSKAIDKAAGAEREVVGPNLTRHGGGLGVLHGGGIGAEVGDVTAPATPDAQRWQGWGTALKPAFEPVVVARKPLIGTVAANVTTHGTGALNIDGCRIESSDADKAAINAKHAGMDAATYERPAGVSLNLSTNPMPLKPAEAHAGGRWPANVVLDESQAEALDEQSGESSSVANIRKRAGTSAGNGETLNRYAINEDNAGGFTDSGGASRFFFVASHDKGDTSALTGKGGRIESCETASTAAESSSPPRQFGDSALGGAVTSEHPDTASQTGSPSTSATPSGSRPSGRPATPTTQNIDAESSPEQQPGERTPTASPASSVGPSAPTVTTTTTTSPSTSAGSAAPATSDTTSQWKALGDTDSAPFKYVAKADASERPRVDDTAHPTVKPLDLMRWLVRLVTPPGGTVLEPFAGSGTTVEACIVEGFDCIAIEKGDEYLPLILQRINRQRDPVEAIRQRGEDLGLFDHLEGAP